jgi:hypothetical protein
MSATLYELQSGISQELEALRTIEAQVLVRSRSPWVGRRGKPLNHIANRLYFGKYWEARAILWKQRLTLWDGFVMRESKKREIRDDLARLKSLIQEHRTHAYEVAKLQKRIARLVQAGRSAEGGGSSWIPHQSFRRVFISIGTAGYDPLNGHKLPEGNVTLFSQGKGEQRLIVTDLDNPKSIIHSA